jgi:hypothetical protein
VSVEGPGGRLESLKTPVVLVVVDLATPFTVVCTIALASGFPSAL